MTSAGQEAPFGSWKSPITAEMIATQSISLGELAIDGDDVYWLEVRPSEGGRSALVKRGADGRIVDVLPTPGEASRPAYSARSLVYAYGGGAFTVSEGMVVFVNHVNDAANPDQRLYRLDASRLPVPITPESRGKLRYGDLLFDRPRQRVLCVREDWNNLVNGQPRISLVAVDLDGRKQTVLAQGHDFYSSPALSPDGKRLAWLAWDAPAMPWDGCELWVADVDEFGELRHPRLVAGSSTESVFQPQWSPQGELYFISDRSNWWNLYRLQGRSVVPVLERAAEFGAPQWNLGMSTYAFVSARYVTCAYNEQGLWRLGRLDVVLGTFSELRTEYTDLSQVRASQGHAYLLAGGPEQPTSVVRLDLETGRPELFRSSSPLPEALRPYLSHFQPIRFETRDPLVPYAHAYYYPPTHPAFSAPAGEKPPLLIRNHGGPTGASSTMLDWSIQYFTSRGFAVVDVNYRGSTGYGREYRLALYGNWGVVDVDDCARAAHHLIEQGKADARRLVASGASAGGYTTLSLLTFRNILRCGASHYGVSNLLSLVEQTQNFEVHYLDQLLGALPEAQQLLRERSPYFHADQVRCPVIFFQGKEDPVVPPSQTQEMVKRLREHGVPVAELLFESEQHGFRIAAHIQAALEAELAFYSRVMGFPLAEPLPSIAIAPAPSEPPRC